MNSKGLAMHCHDARRDKTQLEELIQEIEAIKSDIDTIKSIKISNETKAPAITELEKQIADVKERMHNAIDEL